MALILYGTSGCHLCEQAERLLAQAAASRVLHWQYVDIALDASLCERYGERIPVLCTKDGRELAWPFSLLDIVKLL